MSKRILSGMRPTGKLHIGHYFGAIKNWAALQEEYDCFFMVADWHALSTRYMSPDTIKKDIHNVVIDYIAGGVNPEKCTFYIQSKVPQIAELHLLLSMITPLSWAERCPTFKDQVQQLGQDIATYGFLGYPILQTADILSVKGELVPVGKDQLPHLEISREIARRFNRLYDREVFPEPQAKLAEFSLVPGTDGRKMSKSYNNTILMSEQGKPLLKKLRKTVTDPEKIYKGDSGHPEICNIYYYHKLFNTSKNVKKVYQTCKTGELGCKNCKDMLFEAMKIEMQPVWDKQKELEENPKKVKEILEQGAENACRVVSRTMTKVKKAMKIYY